MRVTTSLTATEACRVWVTGLRTYASETVLGLQERALPVDYLFGVCPRHPHQAVYSEFIIHRVRLRGDSRRYTELDLNQEQPRCA